MPDFSFTLPHWAYWVGLIVFPLIAMVLARRPRPSVRRYSAAIAYMVLFTGGMLGLHRFYLRSLIGFVFVPVFLLILWSNSMETEARSVVSDLANEVRVAERTVEREQPRLDEARTQLEDLRAALAEAEAGSTRARLAQRRVDRVEASIPKSEERVTEAQAILDEMSQPLDQAEANRAFWGNAAGYAFWALVVLMVIDAILIPNLVRRANETITEETKTETEIALEKAEAESKKEDSEYAENWIDRLSLFCGEFVAYWAVIAVFVYYFEVISRYVFGTPTNWAHESMYLMFGMQYLIAGSYAMLTESHVRVDIFYAPLSRPRKAWVDLATSVFFFIFAGTLLYTSWIFALDAMAVPTGNSVVSDWARGNDNFLEMLGTFDLTQWTDPNIRWGEISFNEWEVPLWPMKWVMVMGGFLLLLQGISKVSKDIRAIARGA
ncbi:TRAP transporter small permease subunit [Ruegeria sp. HKCCA6837]|uniref:TRAP transporter small permease subunit n=1 Tax=Ruegeria sp. HKCCA6837 TaxID=2682989 RepID=UPI001489F04D|nr:TRAP transporter small permease subunit [Ruegeria sp. HKCCA6837]